MKLLLFMLVCAVASSVQAFSEIAEAKKNKAMDYSNCSAYFHHIKDREKEEFFNNHGLEFVGRVKDSKSKKLKKWKSRLKKARQQIAAETKNNLESTTVLTEKYGEKCNSIYTESNK